MRIRRSRLQVWLITLVSLGLALILPACQSSTAPPAATVSPSAAPVVQTATPPVAKPLPAATQALLKRAGAKGMVQPERGDVRIVAISDLNSAYGSVDYDPEVAEGIQLLPFWNPDLVLCGGDMVAGQDPTLSDTRLKEMWAAFDKVVAAPLRQAKVPFGFTVGNHDASSALGARGQFLFQRERDVTAAYWKNPAHNPGLSLIDQTHYPFYYTFQFKDIFVLVWDASSNTIPADKLAWVEKALASNAAQSAKMRIVMGHLPLYAVSSRRNNFGDVLNNADQLRSLLEKYNVHTYLSGHHHAYYPGHLGNLQLLHVGILGSGPRYYIGSDLPPRKSLTVIDVKFGSPELTTYTTYDLRTLQVVKPEELPPSIAGVNGTIFRRDVKPVS